MDPDENYRRQIELATLIHAGDENAEEIARASDELAELVLALNGWIANGGFLPRVLAKR